MQKKRKALRNIVIIIGLLCVAFYLGEKRWASELVEAVNNGDSVQLDRMLKWKIFDVDTSNGAIFPFGLLSELSGDTALQAACTKSDFSAVKKLVQAGAQVNGGRPGDFSPIQCTLLTYDKEDYAIIRYLISRGADMSKAYHSASGRTPLLYIAEMWPAVEKEGAWSYDENQAKKVLKLYKLVLKHTPKSERKEPDEETSLMAAAASQNLLLIDYLVKEESAEVNAKDEEGKTALFYVLPNGDQKNWQEETVQLLVNNGADKTITDQRGKTAYDYAAETSDTYLAELLQI